jgi:hypothetical protein
MVLPLLLLTRWGGEAKSPWGPARDGVQARLYCPRALWRADEEIVLRARVRTVVDGSRTLPGPVEATLDVLHEGRPHGAPMAPIVVSPGTLEVPDGEVVELSLTSLRPTATGVWTFSGRLGDLDLLPVEVRVVRARAEPPAPPRS